MLFLTGRGMLFDRREFRLSWRPFFWRLVLLVYVTGVIVWLVFDHRFAGKLLRTTPAMFFVIVLPVAFGLSVLLGSICVFVLRKYVKLSASPDGMDGFSGYGARRHVSWSEVGEAKCINFFGLRYLRVPATAQRGSVWIPLWGSDRESLVNTIGECTPQDSSVQKELRRAL